MNLTRRDVLAAFLGTTFAESACRNSDLSLDIPGGLVDTFLKTGHLLRSEPLPTASTVNPIEVAIVGTGVAGLSAAWRLQNLGLQVRLFELDRQSGGTAKSGSNAVGAFPWGAHYLPAPLEDRGPVARLLRQMDVLQGTDETGAPTYLESALVQDPEERLFFRGQWYEGLYLRAGASEEDLTQLQRFNALMQSFAASVDDRGRKAFQVPLELGSVSDEFTSLDTLSMAQWLDRQHFTSSRLRWWVDYGCRDDYGACADAVSAWAGIWYFAARQLGDERSDGFLSWPQGNGKLCEALAVGTPKDCFLLNTLVHTVTPEADGSVTVDAIDAVTHVPTRWRAKQVILACPRYVAAPLVFPWRRERPAFLDAFTYSPWVVANVTVSTNPTGRGFPLAWDNVFYQSKSLGYVSSNHQRPRAHPGGRNVLTWYYPLTGSDAVAERKKLLATTYEDWRAIVVADLSRAHPGIAASIERIEVLRWGHGMIRPVPGFLFGGQRTLAQAPLQNAIHFAHSDLGGLALFEEANWHGVRAAEAVLGALSLGKVSWL
jgi:phytoene dehydrogenase-like protein